MQKASSFANKLPRAPAVARNATILAPEVTLKCGESPATGIMCIAKHDLIAVSTSSGVCFYKYCTKGEPIRVFYHHKGEIYDMVHLSDDILASVDWKGWSRLGELDPASF